MNLLIPKKSAKGLSLPGGQPRIDWSNPVTVGLVGCWIATGEGGTTAIIRDLVSQTILTPTGTPSIVSGPHGVEARDASGAYWTGTPTANQMPTGALTVLWCGRIIGSNTGSYQPLLCCSYTGATTASKPSWGIGRYGANGSTIYAESNIDNDIDPTGFTNVGTIANGGVYCFLFSGSSLNGSSGPTYLYNNGSLVTSGTWGYSTAFPITYGASPTILIGGTTGGYTHAGFQMGFLWNRQLTPAESASVSSDPTSILSFPEDQLFSAMLGVLASTDRASIAVVLAKPVAMAGAKRGETASIVGTLGKPVVAVNADSGERLTATITLGRSSVTAAADRGELGNGAVTLGNVSVSGHAAIGAGSSVMTVMAKPLVSATAIVEGGTDATIAVTMLRPIVQGLALTPNDPGADVVLSLPYEARTVALPTEIRTMALPSETRTIDASP